jgi:hypothetical protein
MERAALKTILTTAINSQQISYTLADSIASVVGIDLTELIDPIKTADDLLLIGQQLHQSGAIDEFTANTFTMVADSILCNLNEFWAA